MDAARRPLSSVRNILLVAFAYILLSGCASPAELPAEEQENTPAPAPTEAVEDMPAEIEDPTPEPYISNLACVECHTDKETLIANASQVEEEKPESSGEG
jgi:hypothetical protein